ncbi:MAG TPA: lipoyl(octanoyl) transferase LipB [Fimbriimonas sp.]|nr:lipoyl(octanoyl) transferase LipB [Fimbriimonas sp.]
MASLISLRDLGRTGYDDALTVQTECLSEVVEGQSGGFLLLTEHEPVLTLGASFHPENLLFPAEWYAERGIGIRKTDRGGDITYHGPGQIVAYPIFPLDLVGRDVHKWMRQLEEVVILTLRRHGIEGQRLDVNSGVWVGEEKVCAIGIKVRRWVSMHGIALNVNADLTPFKSIIPCGIKSHGVTSMAKVLGTDVDVDSVKQTLVQEFGNVFGVEIA